MMAMENTGGGGNARRRVLELTPEQQQEGVRLLRRADALNYAYCALEADDWPSTEYKADMLETLGALRDEARAEFRRFREEMGVRPID